MELFGTYDENLRIIEKDTSVRIAARGSEIHLSGEPAAVERVARLLIQMVDLLESGYTFRKGDVEIATRLLRDNPEAILSEFFSQGRIKASAGRAITPKTLNQRLYVETIRSHDLVFSIGPAGTGKTYLAVAMAVAFLNEKQVNRIILARPAVEAGEKLGFLPGDMSEKVDPYFRPLYDALFHLMEREKAALLMERGIIEIAPLAFMRGRTLNDSFVILDEAQNTTSEQMKMFLTRIGHNTPRSTCLPGGPPGLSRLRTWSPTSMGSASSTSPSGTSSGIRWSSPSSRPTKATATVSPKPIGRFPR